jgi:hypothetical protein
MPEEWDIQRIAAQAEGTAALNCLEGEHAVTYTLKKSTTGEVTQVTMCVANQGIGACAVLEALGTAGFNIIGTSAECA